MDRVASWRGTMTWASHCDETAIAVQHFAYSSMIVGTYVEAGPHGVCEARIMDEVRFGY